MNKALHERVDPDGSDALLHLLGHSDKATFAEPWQAEVLATTVEMSKRGLFSWKEWVAVFSAEIAAEPQRTHEDANSAYYRQWLAALERLLCERGLTDRQQIAATAEAWRRSYLHTQHGNPVEFRRDLPLAAGDDDGEHDDHRLDATCVPKPVSVSPAISSGPASGAREASDSPR